MPGTYEAYELMRLLVKHLKRARLMHILGKMKDMEEEYRVAYGKDWSDEKVKRTLAQYLEHLKECAVLHPCAAALLTLAVTLQPFFAVCVGYWSCAWTWSVVRGTWTRRQDEQVVDTLQETAILYLA